MCEEMLQTVAGLAVLRRTSRKTLAISVLPDGSLELAAPLDASVESIAGKVEKRSGWIATQRRDFREMNSEPAPKRYVSGATHRYLGKQYRLKISCGTANQVRLKGGYFEIEAVGDGDKVKQLLEKWFRKRAEEQFSLRIEAWKPWCRKHRLPEPYLSLRRMPKRWGSAATEGRIVLNPVLIHAPARCVDYVVAHEICHLRHGSHDRKFYQLLSILMPDWKMLKQRLEREGM
jgi:predicted metal-dependent hydrolase